MQKSIILRYLASGCSSVASHGGGGGGGGGVGVHRGQVGGATRVGGQQRGGGAIGGVNSGGVFNL